MNTTRIAIPTAATALVLSLVACSGPSDTPSATPLAPVPTRSEVASPSPSAAPHAVVTGEDVAILERLENPTTGEVWHAPVAIANLGALGYPDRDIADDNLYFEVGTRGDATIVAAIPSYFEWLAGGSTVRGMFEVDASGIRAITCPSARPGDTCVDWATDWAAAGRSVDASIHYDTLTYPTHVSPLPGWTLNTATLTGPYLARTDAAYGDGSSWPGVGTTPEDIAFLGRDQRVEIMGLGDSTLVEFRADGAVPGLTDSRFAIETPYGGVIASESRFASDYYGQGVVTWNDGVDTFTHPDDNSGGTKVSAVGTASSVCFRVDDSLADDFDPSEWEVAGTHRLGFDVYVPVAGGNSIASAVFETMSANSWGDAIEGEDLNYPYATFDDFLAARSVFAWERPDGEWVIAIDSFALERIYECA